MLDWLAHRSQATPQKTALTFRGHTWSYAELNQRVAQMATHLAAHGATPGSHVAALLPNSPDMVCLIHALARLGAVLIPLNLRLTTSELHWQLEQADAAFLISTDETKAQAAALEAVIRNPLTVIRNPLTAYGSRLTAYESPSHPFTLDSLQSILFTSGTTGRPKGAMLTFANHWWNAIASAFRLGTLPDDCWLACMPLYHVGGQAILFRSCLYGTAVDLHERFDAAEVNEALGSGRITIVSLVPTMLRRLLDEGGDRPFHPALRCILLGGAAATPSLLERCRALSLPVVLTYGLTEAASQVATALPGQTGVAKPGSVGRPLMFTEIRIATKNEPTTACQPSAPGEVGEILVRGPAVMRGYYGHSVATAAVLREGWLHTGDLGYLDDDGDLWVVQRRDDLIISGGENIYPAEVEATLLEHPLVDEACVVGIPDDEWGQRVAALIVPRDPSLTAAELERFCRERLAGYKQPRPITFVTSLPQTPSNKVDRAAALSLLASSALEVDRGQSSRS